MRRWLLALFALQFFCGVSAFAYDGTPARDAMSQSAVVVVEVSKDAFDSATEDSLVVLNAEHGAADEIPELPECLDVVIVEMTVAAPLDGPPARVIAKWTPPALDGPQRPPRSLRALA